MRVTFFELLPDEGSSHAGSMDGAHRWELPGGLCPVCKTSRGGLGEAYPSVDLSGFPERKALEEARQEPLEEYERLREAVRPLAPKGALLLPGAGFGPFVGKASGTFGALHMPTPWSLVVQRLALEALKAGGVRGLAGYPMELRFRGKHPLDLLELEIPVRGQLHGSCFPSERPPPCHRCGRDGSSLPDAPALDGATLPVDVDLFRLSDFTTVIVASERFHHAVERLEGGAVVFKELRVLPPG